MKLNSLLISALLLSATAANGELITGITIQSATAGLNAQMAPEKAISGFGLPGDVPALSGSHRQGYDTNWWTGWDGAVTDWQITVDLEGNYDLDVIHVWNYREGCCTGRGLSNVEIYVSPDGDEANLVKLITDGSGTHDNGSGGFLFPQAPTTTDYLGFDLDLSGVTNAALLDNARLFRIDGGSFNHNGGADHGGLAEIQFGGVPGVSPPTPELITGITIESATVGLNAQMAPEKAINGFGLPGDVPALSGSHRQGYDTNWWTGWDGAVTEWQITVDLEGNYDLDVIHVWNYRESATLNARGLSEVEIYVSPDEDEANLVKLITDGSGVHDNGSGGFLFPRAPGDADYPGFDLDTSGVTNAALLDNARLVRIDGGSSNHNGGADHGGLAEIQFSGIPAFLNAASIRLLITPNASTPGTYDFAWGSQDGKIYDLVSSTDLSTMPDTWAVYDPDGQGGIDPYGDVPSGGDTTTLAAVPPSAAARYFAVVEKDPPPLFSQDFEVDNGGFSTVTTTGSDWERGTPDTAGDGGAVTSGNNGSDHCWATVLGSFTTSGAGFAGYYANPTVSLLRSPVIDLSGVSGAALSFAEALDLAGGDTAAVYVIDAATDTAIGGAIYTAIDGDVNATDWGNVGPIALPAGADGKQVYFEWRFSGQTDLYSGWYVDDVKVTLP